MAVVMRNKSIVPNIFGNKGFESPSATYRPRHSEAPDAGFGACESPEQRDSAESGQGRYSVMESDFTHGRSRS
jgi:hypothetical protein